jgi:NAD(P)-dependent dehydrogenase (short-subunit alcohol dehydrogenase family)
VTRDRQVTADGQERIWQTNFLSHFLLTRLLLDALRRGTRARVVNVSSVAHRSAKMDWDDLELERSFRPFRAYARSKLAQVLFTRELAQREPGIVTTALHPGGIWTGIWRAAPVPVQWVLRVVLAPAAKGAAPVVRLAVAPELEGASGKYFDRWKEVEPGRGARLEEDAKQLWETAERATAAA